MQANAHVPVMVERCVALLAPAFEEPGATFVDATLGLGGHSEAILERFASVRLIGIDRDPRALEQARERLLSYTDRVTLVHASYDELPRVLPELGLDRVRGVLFDLGISSPQVDDAERGFSYAQDAPLDMRMDPSQPRTAADVVNTYPAAELARVLRDYGEERFARRIADAVVRERAKARFARTGQLAELVRSTIPAPARRTGGHPAKRTFQALRIEVNGELAALSHGLPAAVRALEVGGRIVVLAYHSLEDRLVKRVLVAASTTGAPPELPVVPPNQEPELRLLTRGAERPNAAEKARNPRAASARLRAAERIREAA